MNLAGNTILITGGATGIGLALAQRFVAAGSTVIAVGRRPEVLQAAQRQLPGLHVYAGDVAQPEQRAALRDWVTREFPTLNVLINNAGVQRRLQLADNEDWAARQQEIAINLEAPIHLSTLLLPHLQQQPGAAIINVTSGLAFTPAAFAPIYSATKAALHSFTISLREQLRNTGIRVLEIVPPAVNTDLGGAGLHTFGVPVNDFADSIVERLAAGEQEVGYGTSEERRLASRAELDAATEAMNSRFRQ
ncbi:SDR family NAD(P)-dependent oxidoreductase [Hymenobacter gummosus]|uniref:SDR family NAD(P)-dependent oxidoreductase n=1 Tax=Hymenobacter gummosus TaxID=1776032 RepID=A0A3S0H469_9BACT|nr:SDR family NAD(P)-dependent oxidoreductase [Hymenobacter gummosus]RTQ48859.1 SDR family NAD(P)-dependent oxidoreductase [Hymenobacter gummosus]